MNGFSGAVTLNVSGLPAGTAGAFTPSSIGPGTNSTLTVTTAASTPAGDATVTITGTSGGLSHTASVIFTVAGSGAGAPSLSISPTALDFAGVIVNQQSPSQTVTLSAANAAVNLQGVDLSSSAFVLNNQCATDLAAGAQCSISVFFQPATLSLTLLARAGR